MPIHATAIVDRAAEIDATVEIGAYAIVERNVQIGAGTRLYPHSYVAEGTTIAQRCQIHPFAIVGHIPQDTKWPGEPSHTQIGDDTVVREHASIHRGTTPGSATVIGRRCFIMSTGHVGHNCVVADDVIIATGAMLGGHVALGPRAFISGNVVLHQFVRIGELAMIGGNSGIAQDVLPFLLVRYPQRILGPNTVGLRRAGLTADERLELRRCYHLLYRRGLLFSKAVEQVAELVQTEPGRRLVQFLRSPSKRGILPRRGRDGTREMAGDEAT